MEDKGKIAKHMVVIGGGAAGFFCAVNAARMAPGLKVTLLEKTGRLLSKVKVSGGGRCNVTHACFDIEQMSGNYPRGRHFVKKAFHQFFTTDTIEWFEQRGVRIKKENDGRMFPVTGSSQTIINCLLQEADKYHVEILLSTEVKDLKAKSEKFYIHLQNGRQLIADFVCVAAGGYPKSSMFEWLRNTGHTFEEPVPSLFTFNLPGNPVTKLMGVSVEKARLRIAGTKLGQTGPVLITHWGLSGPAVLRLSAWGARQLSIVNWRFSVFINWLPEFSEQGLREQMLQLRNTHAVKKIIGKNFFGLPNRLWEFLALQSEVTDEMRWADLPAFIQNKLIKNLSAFEAEVKGKTTFKEEFVTAGGIKLQEIDANTMMSKKVSCLYFAGEVMDVDGITGGFNFQHAWTSGWVAANSIAGQVKAG